MSLLLFTSLIKHTRKKIKHTRAAGGACSVVRKNIIFSHFQNICSTFTHFQSSLAFAFPKLQYLRYSWDQRPEPGNSLLREEKYPLISVKKIPTIFVQLYTKTRGEQQLSRMSALFHVLRVCNFWNETTAHLLLLWSDICNIFDNVWIFVVLAW